MQKASSPNRRQSLLIINRQQFGYHIDTFYYCRYLREDYDIKYVCWDYAKPKVELSGVAVAYVSRKGSIAARNFRFVASALRELRDFSGIAILKYFPGCSLVPLLRRNVRVVLDIRSGTVGGSALIRLIRDAVLRCEARFFDHRTVISQALARRLKLRGAGVHIVPLGAEVISGNNKIVDDLRLVYVGALGRRIEDTITGLNEFLSDEGRQVRCTYKIIGYGYKGEVEKLRDLCQKLGLENTVEVLGFVPHDQLGQHFDQCNVGVAYIPMTPYFDVQPPTKLFEYLLSGMPAIATATTENKRIISRCNGVLIDASAAGFRSGLEEIYERRQEFDSERIRESVAEFRWNQIVQGNLLAYLRTLGRDD